MNEVIILLLAIVLSFLLGLLSAIIFCKSDGRLIVDDINDEYFVALTAKPEELKKKRRIRLKVITR